MDSIFIILVNFNNYKLTIDCISSIQNSTYKNISIVIVDNGSIDDSLSVLSSMYGGNDKIFVIRSNENNGFSSGNNIGIKFAIEKKADYIMLLNNDTVIDEKMVEILHSKATKKIVTTPKMYYFSKPDTIWYAGGEINYKSGQITHRGLNQTDNEELSANRKCSFVTGCCVMINKNIFDEIGMLDERYFMYGEDVDYSIRLTNAEIDILFVADAKLWHKVGGSSKTSKLNIYYDTRNKLSLMDKFNFSTSAKIRYRLFIFLLYVRGLIKQNNDLYFKKAYIDYRNGIEGKIKLE